MNKAYRTNDWEAQNDTLHFWQGPEGEYYLNIPGVGIANLARHLVIVDGEEITVTPSIEVSIQVDGQKKVLGHGHLTNSIWKDC